MTDLWQVAFVLLFGCVLAEGVTVLALARAIGQVQLRLGPEPAALQTSDGLPLFAEAPPISGMDMRLGHPATLQLGGGRWVVVFVSATCHVCRDVVRDAVPVDQDRGWGARVVIVAQGTQDQLLVLHRLAPKLLFFGDLQGDLHKAYQVTSTPYGFLVEHGRVQAKGIVNQRAHLEALLERRTTERPDASWAPAAGAAPPFATPASADLGGSGAAGVV
jgi:hypothetical protein